MGQEYEYLEACQINRRFWYQLVSQEAIIVSLAPDGRHVEDTNFGGNVPIFEQRRIQAGEMGLPCITSGISFRRLKDRVTPNGRCVVLTAGAGEVMVSFRHELPPMCRVSEVSQTYNG